MRKRYNIVSCSPFGEYREEFAEKSKETIERVALNAHEALGADHVHLKLYMLENYELFYI